MRYHLIDYSVRKCNYAFCNRPAEVILRDQQNSICGHYCKKHGNKKMKELNKPRKLKEFK